MIAKSRFCLCFIVAATLLGAGFAKAQLILPGAVPAGAPPSTAPPAGKAKRAKAPAAGLDGEPPKRASIVAVKSPGDDAVVGRELLLNGKSGRMVLTRNGADLSVSRLTLEGAQISRPDDICRVDVAGGAPVSTNLAGRPKGAMRYEVKLEACPFAFDVLDGAVLAAPVAEACAIQAADCRVDPAGLWGPRASAFGPERVKEIERSRSQAENAMRENFRVLLSDAQGKTATKATASEQAGFSSVRATVCRDYAGEDKHGFCALRLTEARALALRAAIGQEAAAAAEAKPKKKRKPKAP